MADPSGTDVRDASVATATSAHRIMGPRWDVIRHVLAGTEAMRAAGVTYLPRHQEESQINYQDRITSTVLVNMTELVLDALVGRVFKLPLAVEDNVPAGVEALLDDVDLTGTGLNPFCRDWFQEGLAMGVSHVLVDMQTPDWEPPPGVSRTLADDRNDNLRPYWYRVSPENVVAAFATLVNGREVLTHVRIAEHSVEQKGWVEQEMMRIRVLEPDHWELWEPVDVAKQSPQDAWHRVSDGPNPLGFIPLVTFYTGTRDRQPFVCKPPMLDLAYLNVAHWQSSSDQRSILTIARFPILAVSGATSEDVQKLKIGPREWLSTPDSQGKWYYVEHRGRAIDAGEKDLERLEDLMASYGAEFLRAKAGTKSATERILDEAGTISPLEAMALDFQDVLKVALDITASWLEAGRQPGDKLADGGKVSVVVDVSAQEADQISLEALFRARSARDISRRAYLDMLQNRGVLTEDFDHDADIKELETEVEYGMPISGVDAGTVPGVAARDQPLPAGSRGMKDSLERTGKDDILEDAEDPNVTGTLPAGSKGAAGGLQDTPGGNRTPSKAGMRNLPNVGPPRRRPPPKLPASPRRSAVAGRKA